MLVSANYAAHIEYGTSKMEARPYIRPAIDEHSEEIVQAVKNELENEVREKVND